jgi:hypothetical protein
MSNDFLDLINIISKISLFEIEAHKLLGIHEQSKYRIILLEQTYKDLSGLSVKQDELFRQALRCVENQLYRASHVMSWAGFIDFIEEKIASDRFTKLKTIRPSWKVLTVEDLRETQTEYSIIEACRDMRLISKTEMKALHGLLNKRNECAHPSNYFPNLNETLGYVSELITRIKLIKPHLI